MIAETDFITELKNKYYTDQQQNYNLQFRNFIVQCLLCVFTFGAFGSAFVYALIAAQQRNAMNQTLVETHAQNVAQQRALLTVDGEPIPLRGRGIGLRLKDQGRLSATITKVHVKYEQIRSNDPSLFREKEEDVPGVVEG